MKKNSLLIALALLFFSFLLQCCKSTILQVKILEEKEPITKQIEEKDSLKIIK